MCKKKKLSTKPRRMTVTRVTINQSHITGYCDVIETSLNMKNFNKRWDFHAVLNQTLNLHKKAKNTETKVFVRVTNVEPKPVVLLLKIKI